MLQAEAQAQSEKVDAALARLAALGPRGEGIITSVEDFMTDLGLASDALRRVGGNERFLYPMTEVRAQWDLFLSIAKRPASSRGSDSGAYRKYSTFTECLEAICGR